jgi:hypothetical protein
MRKLETIQKREKLNDVFAVDEIGPGGANHEYHITLNNGKDTASDVAIIQMQKGPRKNVDSIHGVIDSDLLEIVRDRLKAFQAGPFASEYNEQALKHIEQALTWMNKRVEDRVKRNVLGTYNK